MTELFKLKLQLKNQDVAASIRALQEKSSKLPSFLVNRSCRKIAQRAAAAMPKVDPAMINQELEVATFGVTKKGDLSRAKKPRKVAVESGQNSFASWIVLASFYPNSKFNLRTGGVFQRTKPNTSGTAAFWQAIADNVSRMVKARRSSTGFYRLCAQVVFWMFSAATDKNPLIREAALTGFDALPGTGNVSKNIGKLAGGTVASGIRDDARASFWVTATEPDTKGNATPKGIYRVAQPVWQTAVDKVAAENFAEAEAAYSQAARESGIKVG
jgi:hypothetical protein